MKRRDFLYLAGGGMATVGAGAQEALPPETPAARGPDIPLIMALFSYARGIYYFNPVGQYLEVGQTVEWKGLGRRTVTAFHPSIENHELRIPEQAEPFDSRTMATKDGTLRWTFEVEGTYDYYSVPQEFLGMVGRIVVGRPGGPGEFPPGYGNRRGSAVMYRESARVLAYVSSVEIVRRRRIPFPMDLFSRKFPWR